MRYYVTLSGGKQVEVELVQQPGGQPEVMVDGKAVEVDVIEANGVVNVRVDGRVYDLCLQHDGDDRIAFAGSGHRAKARVESDRSRLGAAGRRVDDAGGDGEVSAPMPGRVIKLLVSVGDELEAGTPVIVIEAMKMENELCSESAGTVSSINVAADDLVDAGAPLIEISPRGTPERAS